MKSNTGELNEFGQTNLRKCRSFRRKKLMMSEPSIDASRSPSPIPFSKETLSIHELGYELGAYAAEQWPSLMHFKKYKGMSYRKYRNAAAKNCLRVLCQPAFKDEFKGGFMIGFEKNTGVPVYVKNADGHLDFAGWNTGQLSSEPLSGSERSPLAHREK